MRMLHWCMLAVTILLLVCEVAISQLCKSVVTLVDGFHTLFILMRIALLPQTVPCSLDSPASPLVSSSSAELSSTLPAESSIESLPGANTATHGSSISDEAPLPYHKAASPFNSTQPCSPIISPPALNCGVSYSSGRIHALGEFISSIVLASLSISYLLKLMSLSLDPYLVQHPLLLVVVGVVSLLHKILVLSVYWGKMQERRAGASRQPEAESQVEVNHKVLAAGKTQSLTEPGRVLSDVNQVQSPVDKGTLVLCNAWASSIPEMNIQSPQQQPDVHPHAASPPDSQGCEVTSDFADLRACGCENHSRYITELSKDNASIGHLNSETASKTSPVCLSSHNTESCKPRSKQLACLLSFLLVIQDLFTSVLVLINSLVMLLVGPQCLPSAGDCGSLHYLDSGLSLLAVIMLITAAIPQVHKYGLLLLQATPPHISVSDLGQMITGVPGVQAVHDLHIWQLTHSFMVATVHVQCHAGFPPHRCADLTLGVTKVLQSVGVSCCTVQPEFISCSKCSASSLESTPSLPPLFACSLACGKACSGSMCCSLLEEETSNMLAPPAGETEEEPKTLIIENNLH